MTMPKTILITGAGSGLGKESTRQLAAMGNRLIMVCRNPERGEKARKEIMADTGNREIDLLTADFSSLAEIRKLAGEITRNYDKLDVLVNNAGVFVTKRLYTADGHELQWGVNHLAPFLLTGLLLDLLEKSSPSRIITTSSMANYKGRIHFGDINLERNYNGLTAYRQSKLANVLFTAELAEKVISRGITVNCLHPGIVRTSFGHRNNNSWMGWLWYLYKPFMLSIGEGAYCIVKLSTDTALHDVTGKYFDFDGKERVPNKIVFDLPLRKKFWELSEKLAGISFP